MYIVLTPKSKKPLLQTNCLRTADKFAKLGRKRWIFDSVTGNQCTQGGTIGLTLAEFKELVLMAEYCNMRAQIAAHDLYLASVDQSRKITAQEFAHNLQILLNCRYDSPLIFGCHDSQLKQHKTLSIRKNTGWFTSEIIVKI